jgi:hypothetical protein
MANATSQQIAHIVGPVAANEFDNAADYYKPGLLDWTRKLQHLSDKDLFDECLRAIYGSALGNSFRGNWEHEHFKASACHHEAGRRHRAAGHSKDCLADTIYGRAHRQLMKEHGYSTQPPRGCTCGKE